MNKVLTLIFSTISIISAQSVSITGGALFNEWPSTLQAMPFLISFTADSKPSNRQPCEMIFLVDASSAMEGQALNNVGRAVSAAVGSLDDKDHFGLVAFASAASVPMTLQALNSSARQTATNNGNTISTQSGRDLSAGLREAAHQFSMYGLQQSSGRMIIILTNGKPNHGDKDPAAISALADSIHAATGAVISTIGYHLQIDESELIDIAERTGGRAFFVEEDSVSQLSMVAGREATRLAGVCGSDVHIGFKLPDQCSISNLHGATLNGNEIVFPTISASDTNNIYFDISPMPDSRRDVELSISYLDQSTQARQNVSQLIDFPLPNGNQVLNEKTAVILKRYCERVNLLARVGEIVENRHSEADMFTDTITEMKRESTQHNGLLDRTIESLNDLQNSVSNTSIDNDLLAMRLRYEPLRALYGAGVR